MSEEYTCPNCSQPLDEGASFCGNCGQRVIKATSSGISIDGVIPGASNQVSNSAQNNTLNQQPVANRTYSSSYSRPSNGARISNVGGSSFRNNPTNRPLPAPQIAQPVSQVQDVYTNSANLNNEQSNYPNQLEPASATSSGNSNLPKYAVAYAHPKQHRASIALVAGCLGIGVSFVASPLFGIVLGIFGIVLSTISPRNAAKGIKIASLITSILALLTGIGVFVYINRTNPAVHGQKVSEAGLSNGSAVLSVNTPCYSVGFETQLNVNNSKGSCAMNAYNGSSVNSSTDIYKVLTNVVPGLNSNNFTSVVKKALTNDVSKNLSGFTVTSQAKTSFSGDDAYYIQANDPAQNVAVIEEGVLNNGSASNPNYYVIVHVTSGSTSTLNGLQKNWQWND